MSKKISFGSSPRNTKKGMEVSTDEWVSKGTLAVTTSETELTTRFTIDIPSELHRKIKSFCALKGVKMKTEIQNLLENHFVE